MGPLEEVLLAREDREDATETGLTAATGPRLVGSSLVDFGFGLFHDKGIAPPRDRM